MNTVLVGHHFPFSAELVVMPFLTCLSSFLHFLCLSLCPIISITILLCTTDLVPHEGPIEVGDGHAVPSTSVFLVGQGNICHLLMYM